MSIKKLKLITVAILACAVNSLAGPAGYGYIVRIKPGADLPDVAMKAQAATGGRLGHIYYSAIEGFSIELPAKAASKLISNIPGVFKVEPDILITTASQVVPTGLRRINAHNSPIANINGTDQRIDVDIAVIDTGIDRHHPDLNVVGGRNFTHRPPGRPQYDNWDDYHGHGTHVAGIIAALDNDFGVVGVAPGARLWALKALSDDGNGSLSDLIAAVDWVTQNADTIAVANMSLAAEGSNSTLQQAIANSVAAGVVYVAAAGNDSTDIYGPDGVFGTDDDVIPAAYPQVMTISAMRDTDGKPGGLGSTNDDSFWLGSNYSQSVVQDNPVDSPGAAIDLLMPGVSIYSTDIDGSYRTRTGTSMAAPHAAGLVALYIEAHGRAHDAAGVYHIRQTLINSAVAQDSSRGLVVLNDPDENPEKIGYITVGDFTYDGKVGLADFAVLARHWLTDQQQSPFCRICDISEDVDGVIDIWDLAAFAGHWLTGLH